MELTPQALHDVEFREARRGGYNTRDVDDFLERVAVGVGQLQDRLREAYHRAEAAEGRLGDMQRQLDETQRRPANDGPSDADETLRRTLVLAQRTADATIKEAKEEADKMLGDARDEAAQLRASAEADARRDAKVELDQLASTREVLLRDVEAIESHLEEQRGGLREGIRRLQRLLDDPSALHSEPAPEVSDVVLPSHEPEPEPEPTFPQPGPQLPSRLESDASSNGGIAPNGDLPPAPDFQPPVHAPSPPAHESNEGSLVSALQELPRREPNPVDGHAPTEPVAFPPSNPGTTGFLPDLPSPPPSDSTEPPATVADDQGRVDLPLPIDAPPPPPPPPGLEHLHDVGGIPIEPGSRPSEWGRGVFDTDDEPSPDAPRFGRRR